MNNEPRMRFFECILSEGAGSHAGVPCSQTGAAVRETFPQNSCFEVDL